MTEQPDKSYSRDQLRACAYMAAGAGAAAVMKAAPKVVMPTHNIEDAVEAMLAHFYPGAERNGTYLIPRAE